MLDSYRKLFNEFQKNNINFVLWKSLEFYEEQLNGYGDIDVLFDPNQINEVESVVGKFGYAEDYYSPDRIGKKIKVFRGFDSETLKHTIVHAHYGCWFGSKRYKEFYFPNHKQMFETAIYENNAPRLSPAFFIITRMLIVALRQTYKDSYVCSMAREYKGLREEERKIVEKHLEHYFDTDIQVLMDELENNDPSVLQKVYLNAYEVFNSQLNIKQVCENVERENYPKTFRDYYLPRLIKGKRNKISYPVSIMLSGHDGVGKTTLTKMLKTHLAKISMTKRIYLGRSTWSIPNCWINNLRQRTVFRFLNLIWPYSSTLEIIARLLIGRLLVKIGVVVIFDRSLMDLFIKWDDSKKFGAWFPIWVAKKITQNKEADLCYLLHAEPSIVISRKGKGIHSVNEIKDLWVRYQKLSNMHFKIIDTSNRHPEYLAAQIIDDIFKSASSKTG